MTHLNPQLPAAPSLKRVKRGNLCAGCGGCALVAAGKVKMQMEAPGFLRPLQTEILTDAEDARIARICPGLGQEVIPVGRVDDALWGPYVSMQTGWATDSGLRYKASSGGALSAILVHLLDTGVVDAIIQTAAAPHIPIANTTVLSESADDVLQAAGSRYAPSAPLADLEMHLNSPRRFAFVGKPCDVAALRALAREDDRVDQRIPIMVSFFCAGVPSQAGAEEILDKLGANLESTKTFRYRGHGWPGRATATLEDGKDVSMSYFDSWGRILSNHVQLRCKVCADGTGKAADIVCADAWETDDQGYPLFEERDGVSLIVARTVRGEAILREGEATGGVVLRKFDVDVLSNIQTGQVGRRRALAARLMGLRVLGRPIPHYRGLNILQAAQQNKVLNSAKNFIGMIRRGLTGRLR